MMWFPTEHDQSIWGFLALKVKILISVDQIPYDS